MKYTLGFIGCGNMGGALIRAAAKTTDSIVVCDRDENKTAALKQEWGVSVVDAKTLARESSFVVLGVKPQAMEETVGEFSEILRTRTDVTVITMAAGLSIAAIRKFIGAELPVIRIMPNTPVTLGKGMILYTTDGTSEKTEREFLACFAKAGTFDKLPEEKIDAGSALSGCGPAFVYAFAEAVAAGGVECGLSETEASLYTAQTLLGAAEMLLHYGDPVSLRKAVCSPNGTTLAGIAAMEENGFSDAVKAAVKAAYKRTLELKK